MNLKKLKASVAKLRKEVEGLLQPVKIKIVLGTGTVTAQVPALVNSDPGIVTITIWKGLSAEDQALAEAHELMHLYLERKGVQAFDYDCLSVPLRNMIHHHHLVRLLDQRGISNEPHLRIIRRGLDARATKIDDEEAKRLAGGEKGSEAALYLCVHAVQLLDDWLTCPKERGQIEKCAARSPVTLSAFNAGRQFLIFDYTASADVQRGRVHDFLTAIRDFSDGLNPADLKVISGIGG